MLQHACPDPGIADVACQRDRLHRERLPARRIVLVEELLRLKRQQQRPPSEVGTVVELERAFDRFLPLVVEVADEAREAAGVRERRGGGQVGVAERRGDLRGLQQRRAVGGVARQLLRLSQADQRPQRSASSSGPSRSSASANSLAASAGARLSSACRPASAE